VADRPGSDGRALEPEEVLLEPFVAHGGRSEEFDPQVFDLQHAVGHHPDRVLAELR